jgi:hypothetical protein
MTSLDNPPQKNNTNKKNELNLETNNLDFENKVKQKIEQYHYLITEEYAKYLVELEQSKKNIKILTIKEALEKKEECYLNVRIKKIYLLIKTQKGNEQYYTLRAMAEDHTGQAIVVFFDDKALQVWHDIMQEDIVLIGPLKYNKDEFRLLTNGEIKIIQKAPIQKVLIEGKKGNFEGIIKKINPPKNYKTKLGMQKTFYSFEIEINKKIYRLLVWNFEGEEKELLNIPLNTKIRIENGLIKNNEIHADRTSRLIYQRPKKPKLKIKNYQISQEKIIIESEDNKKIEMDIAKALNLFKINNLAEDIDKKSLLLMKLSSLIGEEIEIS